MNGRLSKIRSFHTYGVRQIHVFARHCTILYMDLENTFKKEYYLKDPNDPEILEMSRIYRLTARAPHELSGTRLRVVFSLLLRRQTQIFIDLFLEHKGFVDGILSINPQTLEQPPCQKLVFSQGLIQEIAIGRAPSFQSST